MSFIEQIREAQDRNAKKQGLKPLNQNDYNSIVRKAIEDLSKKIKEERTKKGLTQRDLARKTGYSQSTVDRVEKGYTSNLWVFLIMLSSLDLKITINEVKSWAESDI